MPTTKDVAAWRGQKLQGSDGEKLGTIEDVYIDDDTDQAEWLAVKTGLFGGRVSFVPVAEATTRDGGVVVPYDKERVKGAPHAEPDGALSQSEEAALYKHYGLAYSEAGSDSGLPAGGRDRATETTDQTRGVVGNDLSGAETDNAMTRSEEEIRIGTTQRETGRVRLRKYIETEQVSQTVPVRRETATVHREAITDANVGAATSGADLSEEEHEVVLSSEEAVVEKRVVAKERVRMDKTTVTDQVQVDEQVRKEKIDLIDGEGEPAQGRDGVRGTDDGV